VEDGNVIWRVFQRNLCCISLIVFLLYDKGARMLISITCYRAGVKTMEGYADHSAIHSTKSKGMHINAIIAVHFYQGFLLMNSLPTEQLMHHHHHH